MRYLILLSLFLFGCQTDPNKGQMKLASFGGCVIDIDPLIYCFEDKAKVALAVIIDKDASSSKIGKISDRIVEECGEETGFKRQYNNKLSYSQQQQCLTEYNKRLDDFEDDYLKELKKVYSDYYK